MVWVIFTIAIFMLDVSVFGRLILLFSPLEWFKLYYFPVLMTDVHVHKFCSLLKPVTYHILLN